MSENTKVVLFDVNVLNEALEQLKKSVDFNVSYSEIKNLVESFEALKHGLNTLDQLQKMVQKSQEKNDQVVEL